MTTKKYTVSTDDETPLERVQNHPLPEDVLPLIERYEDIIADRHRFLWRWAHHLFPKFTLSCVPDDRVNDLQDAKLKGLMFVSVIDDIAEKHNEWPTFEEAAKIPFEHQHVNHDRPGVDSAVVMFAQDVWDEFAPTFMDGPRSAEFTGIARFDLKQVVNSMEYSYLANQNLEFVTASQLETYDAHNMMMFGFADIDLMYSPSFQRGDLQGLRRAVDHAQRMVRIGNWVTTWERELHEGDFTSGIVAYALERGIVSSEDLYASRDPASDTDVEQIRGAMENHALEEVFLRQWRAERDTAREFVGDVASVDLAAYLDGIETVMAYHLASEGLK